MTERLFSVRLGSFGEICTRAISFEVGLHTTAHVVVSGVGPLQQFPIVD